MEIQNWGTNQNKLVSTWNFKSFLDGIEWVREISEIMELQNHHADIQIKYTEIKLHLCTHDAGNQITAKDYLLAQAITDLYYNRIKNN